MKTDVRNLWPLGVEEWGLDDGEGDHDLVHDGRVEGVHLLGRREPAVTRHFLHTLLFTLVS